MLVYSALIVDMVTICKSTLSSGNYLKTRTRHCVHHQYILDAERSPQWMQITLTPHTDQCYCNLYLNIYTYAKIHGFGSTQ